MDKEIMDKDNKFQVLVIEIYLLYSDGSWKKIKSKLDPKELRDRFHDKAYNLELNDAENLVCELASEFFTNNPSKAKGCEAARIGTYYYEYPSTITEIIYGD